MAVPNHQPVKVDWLLEMPFVGDPAIAGLFAQQGSLSCSHLQDVGRKIKRPGFEFHVWMYVYLPVYRYNT